MNKVNFPAWDDDVEVIITEIYRVAAQIQSVEKRMRTYDIPDDDLLVLFENVRLTLSQWTGHTYIGHKKDKPIEKAFQRFFEALYKFLFLCRNLDNCEFQEFANMALYRGTLYRYLGHGSVEDIDYITEPKYNNIYVSWSKHSKNCHIERKLYGTITFLVCRVDIPFYGIDLEAFDVVRGEEAEVVFPTIKETITDIKYLK